MKDDEKRLKTVYILTFTSFACDEVVYCAKLYAISCTSYQNDKELLISILLFLSNIFIPAILSNLSHTSRHCYSNVLMYVEFYSDFFQFLIFNFQNKDEIILSPTSLSFSYPRCQSDSLT